MSWKEKRLITVLSIILAVLFAAVLVVLSLRYRAARAERAAAQQTVAAAETQPDSGYTALDWFNGSATLAFARDDGGPWYWTTRPDFPLDDSTVETVLALIGALKPQQTLDLPEDLSEFGLDDPAATLAATTADGAVLSIAMGSTTTDGDSYYATINNDGSLYIIADTLYLALQTSIYDMCVLPTLPDLSEEGLSSVLLQSPLGDAENNEEPSRVVTVLTAVRDDNGSVTWRSGGANVTDSADVRALLGDLAALRVSRCVDYSPSDDAAAFCGFDDPTTLSVSYFTGEDTTAALVMHIGSQNMDGSGRYVRFGDEAAIYLMELSYLDPMMRLAYQGLEG